MILVCTSVVPFPEDLLACTPDSHHPWAIPEHFVSPCLSTLSKHPIGMYTTVQLTSFQMLQPLFPLPVPATIGQHGLIPGTHPLSYNIRACSSLPDVLPRCI